MPKWSLVLFDWDGCTASVESRRFTDQTCVRIGSRTHLSNDGKINLVEILALENAEDHVLSKDRIWSRGTRAKAIAATKEAREMCRRGKHGGYLEIANDSDSEEEEDVNLFSKRKKTIAARQSRQPRVVLSRLPSEDTVIPSTSGRKAKAPKSSGQTFRILFQGEGASSDDAASPNRQPCFYEDLTPDQVDVLEHQVNNYSQQKASCGTMTEEVVVLREDKEIKEAFKRATSGNLSRSKMDVWSYRPSLEMPQHTLDTIARNQVETNRKLGRVLELLESQPLQEISGLSDYLRQLTTPLRTTPEVTVITENRQPLSAIRLFDKENCGGTPCPNELFAERLEEEDRFEETASGNSPREISRQFVRIEEPHAQPSSTHVTPYDFTVINSMIVLHCPPTATIIEVNSPEDIVPGKCEFVVNKAIQQKARMEACSAGNFLWTMTKVLFKEEEMSQKMNFMGKKGKRRMSPRRRHSLVHLYVENFDRRFDGLMKAVTSVNNGLLTMYKKNGSSEQSL